MSYRKNHRINKNNNYYSDEEDNDYYYDDVDDYEPKRRYHRNQYVPDYSDEEYEDSDILDEQLRYNLQEKKDYNNNKQQRRGRGRGRGDYYHTRYEDERNYGWNQKKFERKEKDTYYNNRKEDNYVSNQRKNKIGGRGKYFDYKSSYNDKKYYDDNYYRGREREDNYNNYDRNYKGGRDYKTYNSFETSGKGKHYTKNERTSAQVHNKRGGHKFNGNNRKEYKYQEREIEITDSTPLEVNANSHSGPTIKIIEKTNEEPLPRQTEELNINAAEFYPQSFKLKNSKNQ